MFCGLLCTFTDLKREAYIVLSAINMFTAKSANELLCGQTAHVFAWGENGSEFRRDMLT